MPILHVEKLGGLANFGGARSRLRSRGQVDAGALPEAEKKAVDALFQGGGKAAPRGAGDMFRYRITRKGDKGEETVEVAEAHVPASLAACVKDELV